MEALGLDLLLIVGLALANAFFSGAEIAVLAVRKTRLQELADEGRTAARVALRLREDPERFLATVQVGITVVGATAGAIGGAFLERPFAALLERAGLGPLAAERIALAMVVALVSTVSIVIGELVPKSLALRSSERVTLWVSRPLFLLSRIARPIIWLLTAMSNVVLRPFRDSTTFTEARLSSDEIQQLLEEAAAAGTVDKETGDIASRAIDLGRLAAYAVMLPRSEIAWLPLTATREQVERVLREQPHARYPVVDESEQPAGYVLARELYAQLLQGQLSLVELVRELPAFPESAPAIVLLRELQRARSEIGLVVDESGFPTGLVSIEALAEELFGEIASENEVPTKSIAPQPDQTFLVRGDTHVHEINRELGFELPLEREASTIGGLVIAKLGRFPTPGTTVDLGEGIRAEVKETSPRRVLLVRLSRH